MRGLSPLLCALFSSVVLGACVIAHDWTAAAVSGTVVDAASGKPLAAVKVFRQINGKATLVTSTDSAGRFAVSRSDTFYVTAPMGDSFYQCTLFFRLPGYKKQKVDCNAQYVTPSSRSPALVKLHKEI